MTAHKHTPGPWNVGGWCSPGRQLFSENAQLFAGTRYLGFIQGYPQPKEGTQVSMHEADANAFLIAAAPEMLAALEDIEAALRKDARQKAILGDEVEYHIDGQTMGYAIEKARAAIRKATPSDPRRER